MPGMRAGAEPDYRFPPFDENREEIRQHLVRVTINGPGSHKISLSPALRENRLSACEIEFKSTSQECRR